MSNLTNLIKDAFKTNPKSTDNLNNASVRFYEKYLFQILFSVFEFKNIPMTWDLNYLRNVLFKTGYIGACVHNGIPYCLSCSGVGLNVYSQPTELIFSNVVLGSFTEQIGGKCDYLYILKNNNEFSGVFDIITRYAILLANCDCSINVSLMNSRTPVYYFAENKAEYESLKKMNDMATRGESAIFMVKRKGAEKKPIDREVLNIKNTYIANDVFLTRNSIFNDFLSFVGITNANTDKKERLTTSEVEIRNSQKMTLIDVMLNNMNECFKNINEMYNRNGIETNISVSFNETVMNELKEKQNVKTEI